MPLTPEQRIARVLRRLALVAKDIAVIEGDTPGTRLLVRYAGKATQKTIELMESVQKRLEKEE